MSTEFWIASIVLALVPSVLLLAKMQKSRRQWCICRDKQRTLLRRTSEILCILDEKLIVRDYSTSPSYLGSTAGASEFLGRSIRSTALWPETAEGRKDALHALRIALNGKTSVGKWLIRDGLMEITALSLSPRWGKGNVEICCVGRSIQRDQESISARKTVTENIIAKVVEMAFEATESRTWIPEILKITGSFLGADGAFFFRIDPDGIITHEERWPDTVPDDAWKGMPSAVVLPKILGRNFTAPDGIAENQAMAQGLWKHVPHSNGDTICITSLALPGGTVMGYAGFLFEKAYPLLDNTASILLKVYSSALSGLLAGIDTRRNMERFRQSVDAAGQGIVLIDQDGKAAYANKAYTRLTGQRIGSLEPIWSVYSGSYCQKVRDLILPMVRSGKGWTGELLMRKRGIRPLNTIESFYPIAAESEEPRFVVDIVTDISNQKNLENQLIDAKKEAEYANLAKSNYLATMSHEIRTPLNAVVGLTYLTLQTDLDSRQRDYLEKINSAAKSLLAVINHILDLSKIESGRIELENLPFSLDEMLEGLAGMMTDKVWEKGLKLLFRRPLTMPNQWMGDRFRLGQVLLNLLGNAVKFTHDGHVILTVSVEGPGLLKFSVQDTGIGMTAEQIDRLFVPFSQADVSTSRIYGGTGLGLSISKQIVDLMGGSIWAKGENGKGSVFEFTASMNPTDSPKTLRMGQFRGGTAFIVSGDPRSSEWHREALLSLGMTVTSWTSVKEVMENPQDPQLLLLDVDGIRVDPAKAAYALSEGTAEDFILILSGSMHAHSLDALAPSSARHLSLPMPYTLSRLWEGLEALEAGEKHPKAEGRPETGTTALTRRRVLLADDNAINRQVGTELLKQVGLAVDVAVNGKDAVDQCSWQPYDLVVLDLHMPIMDGYKAASLIRKMLPNIPVIAMTASVLTDVRGDLEDAGFSGYVSKPIDPQQLYASINEVLNLPLHPLAAGETPNANTEEKQAVPDGIDVDAGLRQVLGNWESFRGLLHRFAEASRNYAGELREVLGSDEPTKALFRLHSLRGAVSTIGALSLMDVVGTMEEMIRQGKKPNADEIEKLCGTLDQLIGDIFQYGVPQNHNRRQIMDHLENLIRNSDENAVGYLADLVEQSDSEAERSHLMPIEEALVRWDYDAALDAMDLWRDAESGQAK